MGFTALFGGTFNPPHIGHYEMLRALDSRRDIDEVWLMPDRIPPHKVCDFLASDKDRINMCRIMAEDFKKVKLCLIEFERTGKSYSFDTVRLLKQKYEELLNEIPFLAFRRTGTDGGLFDKAAERYKNMGMRLLVSDKAVPQVSSSYIRSNIAKSEKLLPKKVYEYINAGGIYIGK